MGQKILITGGTGFLGRHLGMALKGKNEVVLGARNNKQMLIAEKATGLPSIPIDVSNIESVRDAMAEHRPDLVIHAAATKFVDRAEKQPMECVDVNVLGSQNVARASIDAGVKTVVGISTDKAAPPVRNIYGLSKAVMERIYCGMDGKTDTRFICCRYGNVAWSTGSVLPIWKHMHKETKELGSTGPDMTRFFFTVDEAVKLILTAMENVDDLHGKVLSRQMKSALIRDILQVWIEEKGGTWKQIEGRPGERNLEFLIGELELDYTSEKTYGGVGHYIIDFNQKAAKPLKETFHSDNASRLTRDEIVSLINTDPNEGLIWS